MSGMNGVEDYVGLVYALFCYISLVLFEVIDLVWGCVNVIFLHRLRGFLVRSLLLVMIWSLHCRKGSKLYQMGLQQRPNKVEVG